MRSALDAAALAPIDVDYVNAHGTGTRLNDATEARALARVFGPTTPPTSSTKPVTGHCLGATPALEAIISVQALRDGCLPPTANLEERDRDCDIDVIADEPRRSSGRVAVSTSLGFWGMVGALVFVAPES